MVYGYGGFSLRNLWVFRYDALLLVCSGSDRRGAGRRRRQGRDGRALWKRKAEHREADIVKVCLLLRFFFFCFMFFLKILSDVEICRSFKSFGFIYIYWLYSGVGHGAVFLLVLMALCGVLFGTTLHVVNVPPTLVNALVYFVWLYSAFNKRFLPFWAQKKFYNKLRVIIFIFLVNLNFRIYVAACCLKLIRFKV